jgi:hypothetical protein
MPFDGTYDGDPSEHYCKGCRRPILDPSRAMRLEFDERLSATRGMSGLYHPECGRPLRSLLALANLSPWS